MKYSPYIIVGLVAITLLYFGIFNRGQPQTVQVNVVQNNLESRTDNQSGITFIVTPINISPELKEWKFDIVMDTHLVELDQDMTKIAVLIDNQGKEYKPINWEGTVGGHHREGVLIFNKIRPSPKSIELKISGIGDVVRNFTWQLNNNI